MKQLGILMDKVTTELLKGYLVATGVEVFLDDDSVIKAKEVICRTGFELTLEKKKVLTVDCGCNLSTAFEIGRTLMSIGYTDLVLVFNSKEYEVSEKEV